MSICDKCERESECLVAHEDDFCLNYVRKPLTNADRIRAMTDEKLAAWFRVIVDCEGCPVTENFDECKHGKACKDKWLEWLRQEATS